MRHEPRTRGRCEQDAGHVDREGVSEWPGCCQHSSEVAEKATGPWVERALGARAADDAISQLNFKIPNRLKKRIKQLAVRDNITLLTMLAHMVELYEKEHGKLGK